MITFRQYLDTLPLAEKRQILAAERRYVDGRRAGVAEDPAIRDFLESMEGFEDRPAGIRDEHRVTPCGLDPLLSLVPGGYHKDGASHE